MSEFLSWVFFGAMVGAMALTTVVIIIELGDEL